jgi:hypothetical protein
MKSKIYIGTGIIIFIIIISIVAIMGYHSNSVGDNKNQAVTNNTKTIQIVAAENFGRPALCDWCFEALKC